MSTSACKHFCPSENGLENMNECYAASYAGINNFGDKLNALLASQVFRKSLGAALSQEYQPDSVKLHAIGSYLSSRMLDASDRQKKVVIFGMGAGYQDFPVIQCFGLGRKFPVRIGNDLRLPLPLGRKEKSESYRVYWVRGPLSARLLGLDQRLAIADAAYLVRLGETRRRYNCMERKGVSFMPHYTAATSSKGLRKVCENLGLRYIDPTASVDEVLSEISRSEIVITEALHGAIVSDALRIPWIPVKSSDDVFEFKWLDFCASIGVEYRPAELRVRWDRHFYNGRSPISILKYCTTMARSALSQLLVSDCDTANDLLRASAWKPVLSHEAVIKDIDAKLAERMAMFTEDVQAGTVFE